MPGSVSVIGTQLHDREQEERVDHERDAGDEAEHAVEEQQEQQRQSEADAAREQTLVERLLAERRGHLRLRDQLERDRQGADPQALGEVLRVLQVADAVDLCAGAAVDPLGVLAEVDRRERDDLVVERDREALERLVLRRPGGSRMSWPRWAIRFVTARKRLAALVGELHRHDGLVGLLVRVDCFGFLMSVPESSVSSSRTKYCWRFAGWSGWRSAWITTTPRGTSRICDPGGGPCLRLVVFGLRPLALPIGTLSRSSSHFEPFGTCELLRFGPLTVSKSESSSSHEASGPAISRSSGPKR